MKARKRQNQKSIQERLPQMTDRSQKKAGRNILIFLCLMFILTTISRGISGATLAVVKTTRASDGEVIRSITGSGVINARGGTLIEAPPELRILELFVSGGQNIEAGSEIVKFDLEEVKEKLGRAQAKLTDLEVQLQQLLRTSSHDGSGLSNAQKELQWTKEEYEAVKAKGDQAVSDAKNRLEDAKNQRNDVQNVLNSLEHTEENTDAREAAQAALSEAEAAVKAAEQAVKDAETLRADNNRQAQRTVNSAENALNSARAADSQQSEQEEKEKERNAAEAKTVQLDISQQQNLVEDLQTLADNNGILTAPEAGIILETRQAGDITSIEVPYVATLVQEGNRFEAVVSLFEADAKKLTIGDEVELSASSNSDNIVVGTVAAIGDSDESGNVTITVALPKENWKLGDSVQIRFVLERGDYPLTVPPQAIRTESNEKYILVVREESTILGLQNILYKIPVVILSIGDTAVGIEAGIDTADKIVLTSTKPVTGGDHVRLSEGTE